MFSFSFFLGLGVKVSLISGSFSFNELFGDICPKKNFFILIFLGVKFLEEILSILFNEFEKIFKTNLFFIIIKIV